VVTEHNFARARSGALAKNDAVAQYACAFVLPNKMAEFYQEVLKWLDTVSGLMRSLPVTPANSEAMARMYTTMFTMLQTFVERLPVSGAAVAPPAVAAKAAAAAALRPSDLVRAAAALPLPLPLPEEKPAARALPDAAPAGAEESEEERPVTNKISLRAHGYRLNGKDTTRFAALEKARAAHGTGTVLNRLKMLQKIWKTCDHPRASEFCQSILADITHLRDIDRRAAGRGEA
jgi:hypothetical protein